MNSRRRSNCLGGMGKILTILIVWYSMLLPADWANAAVADDPQVARGKYLVNLAGCGHCHTPGHFFGKPDMSRYLSGSDVGFAVPGVGTFVGRNLTPDKDTGIGNWSTEQIVTALRAGVRPDGRVLSPLMPWPSSRSSRRSRMRVSPSRSPPEAWARVKRASHAARMPSRAS